MKLLFDQNLSHRLLEIVGSLYLESAHVRDLGLDAAADDVIWLYAVEHGYAITSKDSDFYHRSMLLGHPPKVVWLRIGNCTTAQIGELLRSGYDDMVAFEQDPAASLLVLG